MIRTVAAMTIKHLVLLMLAATAPLTDATANPQVLTGLDVLVEDEFAPLDGQRVGLITNHTGLSRNGQRNVDLLHAAPNVTLVRLFSPEHGIRGQLDDIIEGRSRDAASGVEVVSLYGADRRPTAAMLDGLDTLVFDVQDIGTRFYTYISTMGNAMQAAADHGLRFVVLDRPNPIGGVAVAGPVLDEGKQDFVGFHRLPLRHGMTVGELAQMFDAELGLNLDLDVVRLKGWQRQDYFDDTGLAWINPSPNMRNLNEALLYPGIGLIETTNLSVGRGTATPFELLGAPWLDGERLARHLIELGIPGAAIRPLQFTPDASKFAGEVCHGIGIAVTDRDALEPVRLGLAIARYLARDYPERWEIERLPRLLGNDATLAAIKAGLEVDEIVEAYKPQLEAFGERREAFLLYD